MTPSPACEAFIKAYEACRTRAYMPTPNDKPTIGYGSTGPDIKLGMVWTQAQCNARFSEDLAKFARAVAAAIGSAPTNQHEFDAMVSLAYNIGINAFVNSTLLRKHIAGDHEGAAGQFGVWIRQKGEVLAGLVKRRAAEKQLYGAHA